MQGPLAGARHTGAGRRPDRRRRSRDRQAQPRELLAARTSSIRRSAPARLSKMRASRSPRAAGPWPWPIRRGAAAFRSRSWPRPNLRPCWYTRVRPVRAAIAARRLVYAERALQRAEEIRVFEQQSDAARLAVAAAATGIRFHDQRARACGFLRRRPPRRIRLAALSIVREVAWQGARGFSPTVPGRLRRRSNANERRGELFEQLASVASSWRRCRRQLLRTMRDYPSCARMPPASGREIDLSGRCSPPRAGNRAEDLRPALRARIDAIPRQRRSSNTGSARTKHSRGCSRAGVCNLSMLGARASHRRGRAAHARRDARLGHGNGRRTHHARQRAARADHRAAPGGVRARTHGVFHPRRRAARGAFRGAGQGGRAQP